MARQAALVEPLPIRGSVRVAVLALGPLEWRVEVAARDRPGLLAVVSGVLADHGLDILDAVVATWPDGGTLDSFRVRRSQLEPARLTRAEIERLAPPQAAALESDIAGAFNGSLEVLPNPDADVRFDDDASPWYTLCEVRSPDRRGLLHSLTAGIASAGANVHSAHLVTIAGLRGGSLRVDGSQRPQARGAGQTAGDRCHPWWCVTAAPPPRPAPLTCSRSLLPSFTTRSMLKGDAFSFR